MDIHNISEAKANLSSIIENVVTTGEECLIGKAGKPVVKIIRYQPSINNQRIGVFKGQIEIAPDFDVWPDDIAQILGMDK